MTTPTPEPEGVPDEVMRAFVDGAIGSPPGVKANSPEWVRNGLARALAAYEAAGLAEIEAQRQRAEQAEQALREEVAAMAEERIAVGHANILGLIRQRDDALSAVQRVRDLHVRHDCTNHVKTSTPVPCSNHGICEGCSAPPGYPCRTLAALDQPEDTDA